MDREIALTAQPVDRLPGVPARVFVVSGFKSVQKPIEVMFVNNIMLEAIEHETTEVDISAFYHPNPRINLTFHQSAFPSPQWELLRKCFNDWFLYFSSHVGVGAYGDRDLLVQLMFTRVIEECQRVEEAWLCVGVRLDTVFPTSDTSKLTVDLYPMSGIHRHSGFTILAQNLLNNRRKAKERQLR